MVRNEDQPIIDSVMRSLETEHENHNVRYESPATMVLDDRYTITLAHRDGCLDLIFGDSLGNVSDLARPLRRKIAQYNKDVKVAKASSARFYDGRGDVSVRLQFNSKYFRIPMKNQSTRDEIVSRAVYLDAIRPLIEVLNES